MSRIETVPFCERWYRRMAYWFWILIVVGHPVMYALFAANYVLAVYHPRDFVLLAAFFALVCSFISCTWLPFGYLLVRMEKKDYIAALVFQLGCALSFLLLVTSFTIAFLLDTTEESYYEKLQAILGNSSPDPPSLSPSWFRNVQRSRQCCGLKDADDYMTTLARQIPPSFCRVINATIFQNPQYHNSNQSHMGYWNASTETSLTTHVLPVKSQKGCIEGMVQDKSIIRALILCLDGVLMFVTLVTLVLHATGYLWARTQPMVVLTAKVYLRTNTDDLKSYPEIDSSEGVSVSSTDV